MIRILKFIVCVVIPCFASILTILYFSEDIEFAIRDIYDWLRGL